MNTRTNADLGAGAEVQDADLAGLSEEERAALAADPDEKANLDGAAADLDAAAGGGDDDADVAAADAQKVLADKAAAEKAAADKAAADAAADAENEEKAEAAQKAKDAAEASAKAVADAQKAIDDAKAGEDKKAADAKAAASAGAATTDDDEPFVATYTAPPVEDYDKKVGAFTTRLTDAADKFKAGDMSIDEYNVERDTVERERRDLDAAKLKSDIASEQQVQSAEQRWQWEINRFYKRVEKDEGIKYQGSTLLLAALDTRVKELANDKANADKDSTWFLAEAHRQVREELGIGKKPAAGGDAEKAAVDAKAKADEEAKRKKAAADAAAGRRPARKDLPKDLGGLPAAGSDAGGGDDEFASLDSLDGMELENALARMPKEKADRYLTGAK